MTPSPPTTPRAPASLDQWLDHVSSEGLPVLPESLDAVRALRGRSTLSAKSLESLARGDPALALNALRAAGQSAAESAAGQPSRRPEDVTHALLLLGVDPACQLIEQLPSVEEETAQANRSGLIRALARTAHAAWLASAWAERRGFRDAAGIRAAAQAHHLGELALWARHPDVGACFDRLSRAGVPATAEEETRLFGVEIAELARALSEHWGLPELSRFCLEPGNAGDPQAALVALATRVAAAASADWYGEEMARCQSLLADVLRIEPDAAVATIHADTARAAREFGRPCEFVAARFLLLAPGDRPIAATEEDCEQRPRAAASPAAPARQETVGTIRDAEPASPAGERAGRRLQGCSDLLRACGAGEVPVKEALERLVHEMRAALGVDRVMFAFLFRDRRILAARFSSAAQREPEDTLVRLRLPMDEQHLFSRLMRKPQSLWLNPGNHAKVWPLVPPRLQAVLSRHTFLAMSLFVGDRPLGLFYADCLSCAEQIDEDGYRRFKRLCQATSRALAARPS